MGKASAFAERLSKATRGSDAAARYGGDEFLVVLPECKPENVKAVLQRLRGIRVEIEGHNLPIALSAGWTELLPGESATDLLARADGQLYANKRAKSSAQSQPVTKLTSEGDDGYSPDICAKPKSKVRLLREGR